ncbi:uncharacterized protein [Cardiocondyla obscurior]|uniref:uncharacterized protein n=1 Tax=Cardiocondyla obscurior TaxID=286306 RepID=UPI00396571A7
MEKYDKSFREKRSRYIKNKVKQSVAIINSIHQGHVPNLIIESKTDETNCFTHSSNTVYSNSDTENIDFNYLNNNNFMINKESRSTFVNITKDTSLCLDYTKNKHSEHLSLKIAKWAVENNINFSALRQLLNVLRDDPFCSVSNLPTDPRTLLKTPNNKSAYSPELESSSFHYFGIAKTLNSLCNVYNVNVTSSTQFSIAVNVDGLPLSKSSATSFWPILCSVKSIKAFKDKVFLVALYHGNEKPNSNYFLLDFVNECIELTKNSILIKNIRCNFKILMLICDTPAKSLILSLKSHSGYFSCTKCNQEGEMVNNVICFPETKSLIKRTDHLFRNKLHPEHHVGETLFVNISDFDMINNVPLDYMHILLLGGT